MQPIRIEKVKLHLIDVGLITADPVGEKIIKALSNETISSWANEKGNIVLLARALEEGFEPDLTNEERLMIELTNMMQDFREAQTNYIVEIRAQGQTERAGRLENAMNIKIQRSKELIDKTKESIELEEQAKAGSILPNLSLERVN